VGREHADATEALATEALATSPKTVRQFSAVLRRLPRLTVQNRSDR